MTFTLTIAVLVAIVGLILYFATEGKPSRVGEIAFAAGLFAALLTVK